jgi:D-3-phosphoglycerate dehydrogenase
VGYGSIGSQLSILAESLGMRVIFYDAVSKLPLGNASQIPSLEGLLRQADIVTLHVPDLPSTRNLLDEERIQQMKTSGILINASRGTVVDIDALAIALKQKHLLGSAIDVFPIEPKSNRDEFKSPLRGLDNAILTPHIGGSTQEAQENIGVEVAEKLVRYSDNGSTLTSVNFPEVALPPHPNHHRLLHVHENRPGVLSAINAIFAANQINIGSQFLQTSDTVGYVVIDVDRDYSEVALEKLSKITGTVRCRVLF